MRRPGPPGVLRLMITQVLMDFTKSMPKPLLSTHYVPGTPTTARSLRGLGVSPEVKGKKHPRTPSFLCSRSKKWGSGSLVSREARRGDYHHPVSLHN